MTNEAVTGPTQPLRGVELARRTLEWITEHPDLWDQGSWQYILFPDGRDPQVTRIESAAEASCGTVGCFAGHAVLLAGAKNVVLYDGTFNPEVTAEDREPGYRQVEPGYRQVDQHDGPSRWMEVVLTPSGNLATIREYAAQALGLSDYEMSSLFFEHRTLEELTELIEEWERTGVAP
jgi:hypothetical protein